MNKQQILLQLFSRECDQKTLQEMHSIDVLLIESERYLDWYNGKRPFINADVAGTHWIKTCTGGYITELVFNGNGTLNEYRLFDRFATQGIWSLEGGILSVEIMKADNCYRFSIIGNAVLNIHSAVEHKNDELHSYLKFAQIK